MTSLWVYGNDGTMYYPKNMREKTRDGRDQDVQKVYDRAVYFVLSPSKKVLMAWGDGSYNVPRQIYAYYRGNDGSKLISEFSEVLREKNYEINGLKMENPGSSKRVISQIQDRANGFEKIQPKQVKFRNGSVMCEGVKATYKHILKKLKREGHVTLTAKSYSDAIDLILTIRATSTQHSSENLGEKLTYGIGDDSSRTLEVFSENQNLVIPERDITVVIIENLKNGTMLIEDSSESSGKTRENKSGLISRINPF